MLVLLMALTVASAQSTAEPTTEPTAAPAPSTNEADRARAAELFTNGSTLYDEGEYESAIVAFRESYRLSNEPALFYNIANSLERMGDLDAARSELNTYRALAPADEREKLDRRIATLDRRIEEEKAKEAAIVAAATPPTVVAAQPPAPAAAPMPRAETKKHPRWAFVVAGGAVAALGGAGAGITYGNAQTAQDELDRTTFDQQRTLNGVSWGGVGVGAGIAILGFALPVSSPVSATPNGIGIRW